jgi:hypothetical protein
VNAQPPFTRSAFVVERKIGTSFPVSPCPAAKMWPAAASSMIHWQRRSPARYMSAARPVQ